MPGLICSAPPGMLHSGRLRRQAWWLRQLLDLPFLQLDLLCAGLSHPVRDRKPLRDWGLQGWCRQGLRHWPSLSAAVVSPAVLACAALHWPRETQQLSLEGFAGGLAAYRCACMCPSPAALLGCLEESELCEVFVYMGPGSGHDNYIRRMLHVGATTALARPTPERSLSPAT